MWCVVCAAAVQWYPVSSAVLFCGLCCVVCGVGGWCEVCAVSWVLCGVWLVVCGVWRGWRARSSGTDGELAAQPLTASPKLCGAVSCVVCCGVVWCGVVWRGVVGVQWCGRARSSATDGELAAQPLTASG